MSDKEEKKSKPVPIKTKTAEQLHEVGEGLSKRKISKSKLLTIIITLFLLVAITVGVVLFFVLKPEDETKNIIANVGVVSYTVDLTGQQKEINEREEFNFTGGEDAKTVFSKDIDTEITDEHYAQLMYVVDNASTTKYMYTLSFKNTVIQNFNITCYTNKDRTPVDINSGNLNMEVVDNEDVVIIVEIKIEDTLLDAEFIGDITLTLTVVE